MSDFLGVLLSINWVFLVVICGTVIPLIYLYQVSADDSKSWRFEQLVTDENGEAYSPSFTYMGVFVLGYLIALVLIAEKEWSYLLGLFGTMTTTFAAVVIWRGNTKAKVKIETVKAEKGIVTEKTQ